MRFRWKKDRRKKVKLTLEYLTENYEIKNIKRTPSEVIVVMKNGIKVVFRKDNENETICRD